MKARSSALKRNWTRDYFYKIKYYEGTRKDLAKELGITEKFISWVCSKEWEGLEGKRRVLNKLEQYNMLQKVKKQGLDYAINAYEGNTLVAATTFTKDYGILKGDLLADVESRLAKIKNKNDRNNLLRVLERSGSKVGNPVYHNIFTKPWSVGAWGGV